MMIAILAAVSAAMAVAAGAFGAHGASGPQQAEWLRTGGMYQLVHAVAALAIMGVARGPAVLLLAGGAIFAVTLYIMAIGGPRSFSAAGCEIPMHTPPANLHAQTRALASLAG